MNGLDFYFLVILLPINILLSVGLFGLFKKAGEAGWKGFVPILNVIVWLKITGRPIWWLAMLFIPIVSFVFQVGMLLDMAKSFNKHKFWQHALSVLFPFIYFPILAFNSKDKYVGPWAIASRMLLNNELKAQIAKAPKDEQAKLKKKLRPLTDREKEIAKSHNLSLKDLRRNIDMPRRSELREWLDAILFAGTVALLIRTLVIEAFMIPTSSMEGSLLAGDFLFVSKVHYGVRLPQAPLSLPFIHNKIPGTNAKSFIPGVQLPYARIPGFRDVTRNDIVVFNYPGDDQLRDIGSPDQIEITSMKQNYIKRCVGVPGDVIELKKGLLYINGEKGWDADHMQMTYTVISNVPLNEEVMTNDFGFRIKEGDQNTNFHTIAPNHYRVLMNAERAARLKSMPYIQSVEMDVMEPYQGSLLDSFNLGILDSARMAQLDPNRMQSALQMERIRMSEMYPTRYDYVDENGDFNPMTAAQLVLKKEWNLDNFGPLQIPKKGWTIPLNEENYNLYKRPITGYEHHTLERQGTAFLLDGQPATEYTFEMDYYWLMGDNRHASLDSRFWGFVPEDHVIGRPWAVLISWEGGPRFDRFFSPITRWEPKD